MNKKGFTLVELLATIILIGMLALIIIPSVAGIITRSEKKTFMASVKGIIRAANDYYASDDVEVEDGSCIKATSGTIKLTKDYQITGGNICYINNETYLDKVTNGKYCATGTLDNLIIEKC